MTRRSLIAWAIEALALTIGGGIMAAGFLNGVYLIGEALGAW